MYNTIVKKKEELKQKEKQRQEIKPKNNEDKKK
jgi:hypothetical protein